MSPTRVPVFEPGPGAVGICFVVALYDNDAEEDGDLGFRTGDRIEVTSKSVPGGDWWTGRRGDASGIFPKVYTGPIETASSAAAAPRESTSKAEITSELPLPAVGTVPADAGLLLPTPGESRAACGQDEVAIGRITARRRAKCLPTRALQKMVPAEYSAGPRPAGAPEPLVPPASPPPAAEPVVPSAGDGNGLIVDSWLLEMGSSLEQPPAGAWSIGGAGAEAAARAGGGEEPRQSTGDPAAEAQKAGTAGCPAGSICEASFRDVCGLQRLCAGPLLNCALLLRRLRGAGRARRDGSADRSTHRHRNPTHQRQGRAGQRRRTNENRCDDRAPRVFCGGGALGGGGGGRLCCVPVPAGGQHWWGRGGRGLGGRETG